MCYLLGKSTEFSSRMFFNQRKKHILFYMKRLRKKKCFAPGSEYTTVNNKKEMEMNI